ncbi:MAG: hypothetical protein LBH17_00210 [Oscillospiraceae bacterium]|nr:hypothetical protein [Oscillospiraceae bacterium]
MAARLNNFADFVNILRTSGFSVGGGNKSGIYSVVAYDWLNVPPGTPIIWHTGNPETDPWEWRIRVLNECDDIAYSKCFFNKSGYITREFYPYFLALRRGGRELEDDYADGHISSYARRVYDVVRRCGELPLHEIKRDAGFGREEKSRFDSALTELQTRLYLTICGSQRRRNAQGEEYGWETMTYCTTEQFWQDKARGDLSDNVFIKAAELDETEAYDIIRERVLKLNPSAEEKRVRKFAYGT